VLAFFLQEQAATRDGRKYDLSGQVRPQASRQKGLVQDKQGRGSVRKEIRDKQAKTRGTAWAGGVSGQVGIQKGKTV
jgi:hypothetical protein